MYTLQGYHCFIHTLLSMQGFRPRENTSQGDVSKTPTEAGVPGEGIGARSEGEDGGEGRRGARGERPQEQGARLLGGLARVLQCKLPLWCLLTQFFHTPHHTRHAVLQCCFQQVASSYIEEMVFITVHSTIGQGYILHSAAFYGKALAVHLEKSQDLPATSHGARGQQISCNESCQKNRIRQDKHPRSCKHAAQLYDQSMADILRRAGKKTVGEKRIGRTARKAAKRYNRSAESVGSSGDQGLPPHVPPPFCDSTETSSKHRDG